MSCSKIIRTHSGRILDPANPLPESININDIAHGLSKNCRWGGQCLEFYSVAEHSLHVVEILPKELKLAGLLHDASEAFFCDVPKPLKVLLPDYQRLEAQLMSVIAEKYGFEYPLHGLVHSADETAMLMEAKAFGPPGLSDSLGKAYPPRGSRLEVVYSNPPSIRFWASQFVNMFNSLV